MADNKGFKVKNVIKFLGNLLPTSQGEIGFNGSSIEVHDGSSAKEVTLNNATQTLTNKSISGSTNTFSNIPSSAVNTGAATTVDIATSNTDSTVNIGTGTGANVVNIGGANTTVNITGSVNNNNVTNLNVTDKLITINDGGGAASGGNSGIEVEEAGSATGYLQTSSDRNSWQFKAPNSAGVTTLTPGSSSDVVTLNDATQTLTNKSMSGASNTFTAIPNSALNTIAESKGGTNQTTYSTGDILYASASNTLSKLPIGSSGDVLKVAAGIPSWAAPTSGSSVLTVTTKTANYTATASDDLILCDTSSGSFTITLPTASGNTGKVIYILKTASAGVLTIDGNGSDTITGELTQTLIAQYTNIPVVSNGTSWFIL